MYFQTTGNGTPPPAPGESREGIATPPAIPSPFSGAVASAPTDGPAANSAGPPAGPAAARSPARRRRQADGPAHHCPVPEDGLVRDMPRRSACLRLSSMAKSAVFIDLDRTLLCRASGQALNQALVDEGVLPPGAVLARGQAALRRQRPPGREPLLDGPGQGGGPGGQGMATRARCRRRAGGRSPT